MIHEANGPRGDEQQNAHHHRKRGECEPCPRTKVLHRAMCADDSERFYTDGSSPAASLTIFTVP
jgi:hypothetical protein